MTWELLFWPDADEALNRLESDPSLGPTERAVSRMLDRLELDPSDPRLGTRHFASPILGHVRATAVRAGDWYIFWVLGVEPQTIEIVEIAEQPL